MYKINKNISCKHLREAIIFTVEFKKATSQIGQKYKVSFPLHRCLLRHQKMIQATLPNTEMHLRSLPCICISTTISIPAPPKEDKLLLLFLAKPQTLFTAGAFSAKA